MKERILEPESMDPMEETEAYDRLVKAEQGDILDTCFALSVCRMGITSGKVLDIGTGTGMIPLKLARLNRNLQIIGLDSSANMLKLADRNLARSGLIDRVSYVQGDAKNLPFQGNCFDLVISHVTLHHIEKTERVVKEAVRVLKLGGAMQIRDLSRPSNEFLVRLFVSVFGREYDNKQKQLYADSLRAAFTKKDFEELASIAGGGLNIHVRRNFITHISMICRPNLKTNHSEWKSEMPSLNSPALTYRRFIPLLKRKIMGHFYARID